MCSQGTKFDLVNTNFSYDNCISLYTNLFFLKVKEVYTPSSI